MNIVGAVAIPDVPKQSTVDGGMFEQTEWGYIYSA